MAATYLTPGVYIEEQRSGSMPIAGVGTSVAAFIGFTEKYDTEHGDPTDPRGVKPQLVTNWPQYERVYGGFTQGAMLPFAVKGFFDNGGTSCFIVRIPSQRDAADGNGHRPTMALPPASTTPGLDGLKVEALDATAHLEIEVVPPAPAADGQEQSQDYTLRVLQDGAVQEEISGLNFTKSPRAFERSVREQSKLITVSTQTAGTSLADLAPAAGRYALEQPSMQVVAMDVNPSDLEGSEAERTGYQGLAIAKDVTMVAIPDLVTIATREDGTVDEDTYLSVQGKLVDWCQAGGTRMAILDTPPGLSATRALEWRTRLARDSAFATLYYPNVVVDNPLARPGSSNGDRFVTVSPVGHVAGIWARTDATRGVWKAPANESVLGITRLANDVTDGEQALLNPDGVNCIRSFGVNGMRIWGARTLSSSDPELALRQRPPAVQLRGGVDPPRHPVGGVRAERPGTVGARQAQHHLVPARAVGPGRVRDHRRVTRLLRHVRRAQQPVALRGRRPPDRRGRHRPGEAGRVRHLPHQPAPERRQRQ